MNPFDSIVWDRDGGAIESESFRRIDAEADPRMRGRFSDAEWRVARRLGDLILLVLVGQPQIVAKRELIA